MYNKVKSTYSFPPSFFTLFPSHLSSPWQCSLWSLILCPVKGWISTESRGEECILCYLSGAAAARHPLETISADSPECVYGGWHCCQHQRLVILYSTITMYWMYNNVFCSFSLRLHFSANIGETESKATLVSIKVWFVSARMVNTLLSVLLFVSLQFVCVLRQRDRGR